MLFRNRRTESLLEDSGTDYLACLLGDIGACSGVSAQGLALSRRVALGSLFSVFE